MGGPPSPLESPSASYGAVQEGSAASRSYRQRGAAAVAFVRSVFDKLPQWMRLQRWQEYAIVIVTTQILYAIGKSMTFYAQYLPSDAENQQHSFPVKLGDVWCTAKQLAPCSIGSPAIQAILAAAHGDCCAQLLAGELPHEQVSTWTLAALVLVMPSVLLVARHFASKAGRYPARLPSADALLGFVASVSWVGVVTLFIKKAVGRPRPNFLALGEVIAQSPALRGARWRRTLAVTLILVLPFLSLWVGVTRIQDYWHFQDDVAAGWLVGALSAVLGHALAAQPPPPQHDDDDGGGSARYHYLSQHLQLPNSPEAAV
eukprot:TRINITY_DN10794_c0_g1_i2.p1 TRINITY_DN10794_c0_g1~~TRINITY_DN10794_c0_g1_i2.p1  ORF type:complete len:316 (-),score=88.06 TRINITY_DN10794_c0_g1_i2:415-1362(-)